MFCIGNFLRKKYIFDYRNYRSNDQAAKLAFGRTESSTIRAKVTLVYADELGMESTVRDTFSLDKFKISRICDQEGQ